MRLKGLLGGLGLSAAALAVLILLCEFALQVGQLLVRPRMTKLDPLLGWYHTPGGTASGTLEGHRLTVSYNSLGYRSPEYRLERVPGTKRVVVLGDSFTEGGGVNDDEVFTRLLEKALGNVEVINLGVYGYNTAQEYLTLKEVGLKFAPDAAVLVVFTNDIPGNVVGLEAFGPAPSFLLDGDSLRFEGLDGPRAREAFRVANIPVPGWFHRHSLVYYALNHYVYQRLTASRTQAFIDRRAAEVTPGHRTEVFRRIVRLMQRVCDEHRVRFQVVFVNARYDFRTAVSPMAAEVDSVRADGTDVVDLFQPLRSAEAAAHGSLYFEKDIHWNLQGHRLVADLLEPSLRRLLADSTAGVPPPTSSGAKSSSTR